MTIHLETERLILREFTSDDVDLLVDLDSDPEVMRYLSGGPAPSRESQEDSIMRVLKAYEAHPGYGFFVALEKPSLEFIGWFHFRPDRYVREYMEVGYRLKQVAWGRGFATEGSRGLVEKGLAAGIQVISGRALKANLASIHVLEKSGLKFIDEYQEAHFPGDDKTAVLMRLEA